MADAPQNPLGLSDEDFMNQPHPPEAGGVSGNQETSTTENTGGQGETENSDAQQQETQENQTGTDGQSGDADGSEDGDGGGDATSKEGAEGKTGEAGAAENKDGEAGKTGENAAGAEGESSSSGSGEAEKSGEQGAGEGSEKAPDYAALYGKIMAPFQANGKKIELKSPEEAIQLMQMGANYTRKLQEIAPHRKIITMLGNHGLLDESKLSFFIALDKKDPEAIKKLIVDSGIDPLDIDTKIEPAYQEGSYQVTDEEVAFRTQLEDLSSTDTGKQTLQTINSHWDQASKDMLWQHPEVMPIIHSHRENGIYSKITEEMDRRRTLGQLLPTTPFLEAYKAIGDELHASGAFGAESSEQGADGHNGQGSGSGDQNQSGVSAEKPAPKVVATDRAAAPRPSVDNGDKAGAASPSRAAPGKAAELKNPLAMSDEDFLKANNLEGRV